MAPKKKPPGIRAQVDITGIKDLIDASRNTTEWKNAGDAARVRILAAERILLDIGRKNPADVTDELLATLDITRERADELLS